MAKYTKEMHEKHLNKFYMDKYNWNAEMSDMCKEFPYAPNQTSIKTAWKRGRLGSLMRTHNREAFNQSYLTQDLREVCNG